VVSTVLLNLVVAMKLKDHRLKPGGVNCFIESSCSYEIEGPPAKSLVASTALLSLLVVMKLKDHRLKPGGVNCFIESSCSYEIEGPPAKSLVVSRGSKIICFPT